jgi:hypothetical protein
MPECGAHQLPKLYCASIFAPKTQHPQVMPDDFDEQDSSESKGNTLKS